MAASVLYQIFTSLALMSLGLYHLVATIRSHLKSPQSYLAKPFHSFPPSASNNNGHRLKHLQLYLLVAVIIIAFVHEALISSDSDPLLQGHSPVHLFTSLQSAVILFLFLVLSLSLLLSDCFPSLLPLPHDFFFAFASALFYLQSAVSSGVAVATVQTSDIQAKCDSLSARISALSALLCLLLACQPKLFVADVTLAASICLQGLWTLQTGLSLYVEAFIPEGCHRLLDVVKGVEGSTKCDLEESSLRAVAILDLAFLVHVMFVLLIVLVIYAVEARTVRVLRLSSYEAVPTVSHDLNHIQMKSLSGTKA